MPPQDQHSTPGDPERAAGVLHPFYTSYNQAEYTGQRRARVIECLWRDPTVVTKEITVEEKSFKLIALKYPHGRRTVIAGGKKLKDGPIETKRWDIIHSQFYQVPGSWFGIGEIENLETLQLDVNKGLATISDNRNQTANSTWIVDSNSDVTPNMIFNKAGLVIVKTPGSEVIRSAPPPLPAYIANSIKENEDRMEELAGIFDFQLIRKAMTHVAGRTIENEQTAGHTSIRLQLLALETAIQQDGEIKIELIRRHWKREFAMPVPSQTGKIEMKQFDPMLTDEGLYAVRVGHGSTLPVSRSAMREDALALHQAGALDKEELLYILDVPNKEQILKRMADREQSLIEASKQTGSSPANIAQPSKGRLPAGTLT